MSVSILLVVAYVGPIQGAPIDMSPDLPSLTNFRVSPDGRSAFVQRVDLGSIRADRLVLTIFLGRSRGSALLPYNLAWASNTEVAGLTVRREVNILATFDPAGRILGPTWRIPAGYIDGIEVEVTKSGFEAIIWQKTSLWRYQRNKEKQLRLSLSRAYPVNIESVRRASKGQWVVDLADGRSVTLAKSGQPKAPAGLAATERLIRNFSRSRDDLADVWPSAVSVSADGNNLGWLDAYGTFHRREVQKVLLRNLSSLNPKGYHYESLKCEKGELSGFVLNGYHLGCDDNGVPRVMPTDEVGSHSKG